jgi:uncharacterized OsmC-like protein
VRDRGRSRRTIRICHRGDSSFSIQVRDHAVVVDLPFEAGGEDAGPSPTELFVASMAAGMASFARGFLHARGLADRVEGTARWGAALDPLRVGRVTVRLHLPPLPGELVAPLRESVEGCTVLNSIRTPPELALELVPLPGPAPQATQG